jgi:hypothetical protein
MLIAAVDQAEIDIEVCREFDPAQAAGAQNLSRNIVLFTWQSALVEFERTVGDIYRIRLQAGADMVGFW